MDKSPIKLDGRQFGPVGQSLTAAQDDYINANLRLADAMPIIAKMNENNYEQCAQELLTNIMLRGLKFNILAGVLAEQGRKWSRSEAERNAARFAEITDEAEKHLMQTEVVGFVLGFTQSARQFSRTSQSSSTQSAAADGIESEVLETSAISG